LIRGGHEVTVIAWDREKENPPRQDWDGIKLFRLRTRLLPKRYRSGSPLWVGFNLILWQRQAYRQALALDKEKHFDVLHCNDLDTLAIGTRLKRKLRIPLVYDAYEIYGYMVRGTVPRWIANLTLWLEKRLIRKVDKIITVVEPQRRYFGSIADKPITVIMNCKPLQSLEYQPPNNESFTLLYIGGLRKTRMLLELVAVVKELAGVRCLIGGIGQPSYVQGLEEECSKASNATFVGKVPFDEVIPMTRKADCIFLMISPEDSNSRLGLGNKQFEAMVCGRPIICTKRTYSGEITEQEDVGLAAEYNEEALREVIIKLRDNPELREKLGRNALKAAVTKYNWQKQEEKLLELYEGLHGV